MESNHNGAVDGASQAVFDYPDFSGNANYSSEWDQTTARDPHQQFYPHSFGSSSFPSYNHSYRDDSNGHFPQPPYPPPSYYQPNPAPEVAYDGPYQSHPYPSHHQSFHPHSYSTYHPTTIPNHPHYRNGYAHDYQTPSPYREASPMQRMQQLARQQYGGTLAAQTAAAAAAEAAQAARRISPPRGKREGGEETVRDVLHRQYLEKKRREESQMQQAQQSQQPVNPNPSYVSARPQVMHSSMPDPASLPTAPQSDVNTQSAPVPTFPGVVAPTTPASLVSDASPPTTRDATTALRHLNPSLNPDVGQQAMVARLKKQSLMASLHRANTVAAEANPSEILLPTAVLHQAATVVQALEEGKLPPPSSSRKRPLEEADRSEPALKPGMRSEINEKGEAVERLYVLVHHCNHNDPDYNPEGVLMPFDEYKKEEKRDDMITFSYSSVVSPYEYVDFRVRKPEDAPEASSQP